MDSAPRGARLSIQSYDVVLPGLPATAAGTVPTFDLPTPAAGFQLLGRPQSEGGIDWPRVIDISTQAPADFLIDWTAGRGGAGELWVTVSRAARIAVQAASLGIQARNRSNAANQIHVGVADGVERTKNGWLIEWAQAVPPATQATRVPPHAAGLRVSSSVTAGGAASGAIIRLRNAYATIIGQQTIPVIPTDPIGLAGIADVVLVGLAVNEIIALHFDLEM